ncbi:squalene/phytoene synthase family protein [Corynebacterium sp. MSK297]|uniref:phytoene/squalene synthase family protein n=1 Tax=Corynebacterium sp. MSK297 TaxID=3050221 RepID=UPI00254C3FB2|nr:squalene/phytoene synthase family protein [Corynebacterium sp. MSK297]MDK8846941.1 squalene/phytoene synthase family protein [Corynebacterium sp. MSK297]
MGSAHHNESLRHYDRLANNATTEVIKSYSSSFHAATCLYPRQIRQDIRNIYAVVRIADEIVDGTAGQAAHGSLSTALDNYEKLVLEAPKHRFHTDLILHGYANTARRCGLSKEYVKAFFRSMRMDLRKDSYTEPELADYIYGSAEVIGLLCLEIFFQQYPKPDSETWQRLQHGAKRLGAGFQKANFLRDYTDDVTSRGRYYYPELATGSANEAYERIIQQIYSDFAFAEDALKFLPSSVQPAVRAALRIYRQLAQQLAESPAAVLGNSDERARLSVSKLTKASVLAQCIAESGYGALHQKMQQTLQRK